MLVCTIARAKQTDKQIYERNLIVVAVKAR